MDTIQLNVPHPPNESGRLAALNRYQILDTAAEADFDFLAALAAQVIGTPYAFVSLVDSERVWYKAKHGRETRSNARDDDYCSLTILEPGLLVIPDLANDPRTAGMSPTVSEPNYRMYAGANLITDDGYCIGVLCVLDVKPRQLHANELELLQKLAHQTMQLIELRNKRVELEAALAKLERLAATDPLTGLANRRTLHTRLETEIQRSRRFGTELSVVLFDLDHFKGVNDRYGHANGDAVLCNVAKQLMDNVRTVDVAARYGGEEFCVVLPETDAEGATVWAENFRERLADARQQHGLSVTGSFGVASSALNSRLNGETLLALADKALYQAKDRGRNQVVTAQRERAQLHLVQRAEEKLTVAC